MDPPSPPPGLRSGVDLWADELNLQHLLQLAADEPLPHDTNSENRTRSDAVTVEIPDLLSDFDPLFAPPTSTQFRAAPSHDVPWMASPAAFDSIIRTDSPVVKQPGAAPPPGPPWSPPPFDGIGVSGLHASANAPQLDVSTNLMCKMTENLGYITRELASMKSDGTGHKTSLAPIPKGEESRPLPSAKAWRSWTALKLIPWCGLQVDGFADAVRNVLSRHVAGIHS